MDRGGRRERRVVASDGSPLANPNHDSGGTADHTAATAGDEENESDARTERGKDFVCVPR